MSVVHECVPWLADRSERLLRRAATADLNWIYVLRSYVLRSTVAGWHDSENRWDSDGRMTPRF